MKPRSEAGLVQWETDSGRKWLDNGRACPAPSGRQTSNCNVRSAVQLAVLRRFLQTGGTAVRLPLILATGLVTGLGLIGSAAAQADDLKIALIYGKTGPLEAYAKQTETGLRLGFEYATKGTMVLDGRKIVIITKVDIAIGSTSSAAALADLPVAEENKKILIVEPAVADQITGEKWNRYIFRTGRNSSQDAISNAVAIGKSGVTVATLAQDYAFGRDGVAAFKEALA